jgi:pimeloyl-ACP methyl ester carboxylesterase
MKKLLMLALLLDLSSFVLAQSDTAYGNNASAGTYAQVNGIKMYYEIYGTGQPLLLLHGNGGSIASRTGQIGALSKKYKVIAVDSRCHGKSGCNVKDLNYELMADDINQLLTQLKIDSCLIWGHSDGGILGLILAYTHPEKVKRLVATGANIQCDSTALQPELIKLAKMYPMIPDTLMQKQIKLTLFHPNIAFKTLNKIKAPVLLVSGDRDAIQLTHTINIFKNIPNAQLCVLPGATHFAANEKPQQFLTMMVNFFDRPFTMPSTVKIMEDYARRLMEQSNNKH